MRRLLAVVVLGGLTCLSLLGALPAALAQDESPEPSAGPTARPLGEAPVLLIMDASGSMNADDGTGQPKIAAARQALTALVDGLPDIATVGLRAYGHRTPNTDREAGCADTELLVPIESDNRDALRTAITNLDASGFTPIGTSLRAALGDFPVDVSRTVVLVSDGIDTCAPPPACDVAREIVAEGVDLRVETVGFQADAAAESELRCIAEVTGGTYRPAENADDLARELRANIPTGEPIEGGPTPNQATPIEPGQYVDTLAYPEERWYSINLAPGDRVRATAAIVGTEDTPDLPGVISEMFLGFGDVIGTSPCDTDLATGIGPFTLNLAVDGLQVAGGTVCSDPGLYVIGIMIPAPDDRVEARLLEGVELPVELFVAVTSDPVAEEQVVQEVGPEIEEPPPVDPGRLPTPISLYLLAAAMASVVGAVVGSIISRRLGP